MSTSSSQLLADVAQLHTDAGKLHSIVHGPASGPGSTVPTDGGMVATAASAIAAVQVQSSASIAAVQQAADVAMKGLGYAVPVPYAAGISMTAATQTVTWNGATYAPVFGSLPFVTSGTFEAAKFRLIQGVAATDLAGANGAALVGYGGTTAGSVLDTLTSSRNSTIAAAIQRALKGTAISVACYGDSITYGQDTSATGVATQINGAPQTRSTHPFPESLAEALGVAGYAGSVTVINRGFPGDSTIEGISRWASASATDVSFIMYGHNDANNYGGYAHGPVSVADYRTNLAQIIQREITKGAAVIVLAPPNVQSDVNNDAIRPYAKAAKELARIYGVEFVDTAEMLQTVTSYFTDGVHLTSFAYSEIGWQLAGLFMMRNGEMQRVASGEIYYPDDALGHCPPGAVITWTDSNGNTGKGNGRLIALLAGQSYAVGVDCTDEVTPIVHSVLNAGAATLKFYYSGGGAQSDRGVPSTAITHDGSYGLRQSFVCTKLKKGRRMFAIRNDGSTTAYIEAIEFVGKEHLHTTRGNLFKSVALTGAFTPYRISNAQVDWWGAVDVAKKLVAPYGVISRVKLPAANQSGLAVWASPPTNPNNMLGGDALFVLRNDTVLIIREFIGGASSDTLVVGMFTTGVDWDGEVEIATTNTGISVYLNGTLVGTRPTPTLQSGWPGLLCKKGAILECRALYFNGHVKGPY
jgi:lysophospholipase L1-like esterase